MLIVIEGIDGSGKSTTCKVLRGKLPKNTEFYRTPGSGIKEIRELTMNPCYDISKTAKMFLFLSEMIHLNETLELGETKGRLIIFDRFYVSTLIYQYLLRKKEFSKEQAFTLFQIMENFMPKIDITFILTTNLETAVKRSQKKSKEFILGDAFEDEERQVWEERMAAYRSLPSLGFFSKKLGQVCYIDTTNLSPEEISEAIQKKIGESCGVNPDV